MTRRARLGPRVTAVEARKTRVRQRRRRTPPGGPGRTDAAPRRRQIRYGKATTTAPVLVVIVNSRQITILSSSRGVCVHVGYNSHGVYGK